VIHSKRRRRLDGREVFIGFVEGAHNSPHDIWALSEHVQSLGKALSYWPNRGRSIGFCPRGNFFFFSVGRYSANFAPPRVSKLLAHRELQRRCGAILSGFRPGGWTLFTQGGALLVQTYVAVSYQLLAVSRAIGGWRTLVFGGGETCGRRWCWVATRPLVVGATVCPPAPNAARDRSG
jgi:hypothetical protein